MKLRWLILRGVFGLFFLLTVTRLFKIQILDHAQFTALAAKQHWSERALTVRRGEVFSRGSYPLAANQISYLLYAEPKKITDPKLASQKLLPHLRPDLFAADPEERDITALKNAEAELGQKLDPSYWWVALAHYLTEEEKTTIEGLGLPGLGFEEEYTRFYPEGELACHLLGFVGQNEAGQPQGYFGIEGYYNGDLQGQAGRVWQEQDPFGNPIIFGGFEQVSGRNGRDLVLTIDRVVQFLLEEKLREGVKRYQAKSGTAVVVDPQRGAILAMANYPGCQGAGEEKVGEEGVGEEEEAGAGGGAEKEELEAAVVGEEGTGEDTGAGGKAGEEKLVSGPSAWPGSRNYAIATTYEPGSVMKALTMAAGLDLGMITPQTSFDDRGPKVYSGHVVDTWDGKHYGEETMVEVLQHSNNMGAAWVAERLGVKKLYGYLTRFGIGKVTGIDLEGEDTGVVRPPSEWREIDLATASFGQGISATPLQVANVFATIANEGVLMRPFVVERFVEGDREVINKPRSQGRVISAASARTLTEMLVAAVSGGEAKYFVSKRYRVAGKTGTAQVPIEGKYDPQKTNATFVGFLPESKKFVMLLRLEEPTSSVYAAETAVPLWMEVAEQLAAYWGIPPDYAD